VDLAEAAADKNHGFTRFKRLRASRSLALRAEARGVGTVVASLFFLAIFMAASASLYFLLTQYGLYHSTAHEMAVRDWERLQERFAITSCRASYGRLNLTVENVGPISLRLVQLWVVNLTDNDHRWYPLDLFLEPGERAFNVGSNLYLEPDKDYEVFLVSSRGNKARAEIRPAELVHELLSYIHFAVLSPDKAPSDKNVIEAGWFHLYVVQRSSLEHAVKVIDVSLRFYDHETGRDITDAFTLEHSTPLPITLSPGESCPISHRYTFERTMLPRDLEGDRWVDVKAYVKLEVDGTLVTVEELSKLTLIVKGW